MTTEIDKHKLLTFIEDSIDNLGLISLFDSREDISIFCELLECHLTDSLTRYHRDIFDYTYNKMDI